MHSSPEAGLAVIARCSQNIQYVPMKEISVFLEKYEECRIAMEDLLGNPKVGSPLVGSVL